MEIDKCTVNIKSSLVDVLKNRDVKQSEILKDLENRHQEVDGFVNALPTTCFEKAFDRAARFEKMEGKKFLDYP